MMAEFLSDNHIGVQKAFINLKYVFIRNQKSYLFYINILKK